MLPVTLGLLNQRTASIDSIAQVLLAAAIAAYIILLGSSVASYRIRDISFRPDIPTLKTHSTAYTGDQLQRWIADEHTRSIVLNDDRLARKGTRARWVVWSLYAEGLLLSSAALTTVF